VAYEDLLKSVEESAGEKERELRNKAAAAIGEIRERAKVQAEGIRQGHRDEAVKSIAAERNKTLYLARADNKELLISTREAAFERAFREAELHLDSLRSSPKYPQVFEKLLREAAGAMENEHFVLHIDPRDEDTCKNSLRVLGISCEIRSDLKTAGGVVASRPDNTIVISNTAESRLQRVRESRRKEIHAILSGA
jgi:V/A-type H+/Na+-transporting ATPase subunit E